MAQAGIRDLRDHLSHYLDRVREGEELIVTDRGRPIARITPVAVPRPYDRLVAEGLIEPPATRRRTRPTDRVQASDRVSTLVASQRR